MRTSSDGNRPNSSDRGYDHQWQKVRARKVKKDPFCERCLKKIPKLYVPISVKTNGNYGVVHHIKPIETHPHLRLVMENLESLCFDCHEREHGRMKFYGCDVNGFPTNPNHPWNKKNG